MVCFPPFRVFFQKLLQVLSVSLRIIHANTLLEQQKTRGRSIHIQNSLLDALRDYLDASK
jgi:hypothetical protein